jgi:hypothetical protein
MTHDSSQPKNQIPMPVDDFPDPTDAQLEAIARARATGDDPYVVLATPTNGKRAAVERDPTGSTTSLTLLAVGALTYGMEMLSQRAEHAGKAIDTRRRAGTTGPVSIPEDERAKYALMGLLFRAPSLFSGGTSVIGDTVETAANVVIDVTSPITNSRLFRPARNMYDGLAQRGEAIVDGLAQLGAQGQDFSKELIEDATFDAMSNVVGAVAENEEIRDLVQQQAVGFAQEFLTFVQDRLESVDLLVQRIAFKIIPGNQADRAIAPVVEIPWPSKNRALIPALEEHRSTP